LSLNFHLNRQANTGFHSDMHMLKWFDFSKFLGDICTCMISNNWDWNDFGMWQCRESGRALQNGLSSWILWMVRSSFVCQIPQILKARSVLSILAQMCSFCDSNIYACFPKWAWWSESYLYLFISLTHSNMQRTLYLMCYLAILFCYHAWCCMHHILCAICFLRQLFVKSSQSCPKSGLHNPLRNSERCVIIVIELAPNIPYLASMPLGLYVIFEC
jgi:hypothetical protein